MRTLFAILFCLSAATKADELYAIGGIEHFSSILNGKPFNSKHETSVDFAYAGLRLEKKNWTVEASVAQALQPNQLEGSNPRAIFRIEKKFRIK